MKDRQGGPWIRGRWSQVETMIIVDIERQTGELMDEVRGSPKSIRFVNNDIVVSQVYIPSCVSGPTYLP